MEVTLANLSRMISLYVIENIDLDIRCVTLSGREFDTLIEEEEDKEENNTATNKQTNETP